MAKNVHESGSQKDGGGGWSRNDSKNLKAALDGIKPPGKGGDSKDQGEKPKTGAQRDIGRALDGRE
ncbi:hypothetical protein JOF29_004975 [Kribbella aluminosa]|uniref:Uncharacterized protein n=1 Tax=Kribbella aluminosa TaxID=416017 RepID=A0ABS4UQE2_9ACTN|nr:hypothetical protein [Kribbella aluminosa]MBP2353865.1 hypothetical protein [Kribbella aluminosa]